MSDHPETPATALSPAEVTLLETAAAAATDAADLAGILPGDLAANARLADSLAEELSEISERLRSLPQAPREMTGHAYAALAACRTAVEQGEDIGEFIAATLGRLAAEMGGTEQVLANRSGRWEAGHIRGLLAGTAGSADEWLPPSGGAGGSLR